MYFQFEVFGFSINLTIDIDLTSINITNSITDIKLSVFIQKLAAERGNIKRIVGQLIKSEGAFSLRFVDSTLDLAQSSNGVF